MYHVLTCFIEQKKGVIQYMAKILETVFLYYFQTLIKFFIGNRNFARLVLFKITIQFNTTLRPKLRSNYICKPV